VNQFTYLLNFCCLRLLLKRSGIRVGYCCAHGLIEPIYEGEDEPHATFCYRLTPKSCPTPRRQIEGGHIGAMPSNSKPKNGIT
jgi:hypothetical protein